MEKKGKEGGRTKETEETPKRPLAHSLARLRSGLILGLSHKRKKGEGKSLSFRKRERIGGGEIRIEDSG